MGGQWRKHNQRPPTQRNNDTHNNNNRSNHRQQDDDVDDVDAIAAASCGGGGGGGVPKHCKGLVHFAFSIAYSGIPFRGLQLQTHEHISHTVEGFFLLALRRAGYLLQEDFTPDGKRLRYDGGIRIVTDPEAVRALEARFREQVAESRLASAKDCSDGENQLQEKQGDGTRTCSSSVTAVDGPTISEPSVVATAPSHQPGAAPHFNLRRREQKELEALSVNKDGQFRFARSCRTDRGVHAARNVVSVCLREQDWIADERCGQTTAGRINAALTGLCGGSRVVEVLAATPVLPSFDPRNCCSRRAYRYLIPLYAVGWPAPSASSTGSSTGSSTALPDGSGSGQMIDDWDRLFAAYPEVQTQVRRMNGEDDSTGERCEGQGKGSHKHNGPIFTVFPKPSELLIGDAGEIAQCAADTAHHDSAGFLKSSCWDHPELRRVIAFANAFLDAAYVGAHKCHNLTAVPGDGQQGHQSGHSKRILGTSAEATRSLSRCELAPMVVWLSTNESDGDKIEEATIDSDSTLSFLSGKRGSPADRLYRTRRGMGTTRGVRLPYLVFQVEGQSFLLHMIRKMVGLLIAVLRGGRPWWAPLVLALHRPIASAIRPLIGPLLAPPTETPTAAPGDQQSDAPASDLKSLNDGPPPFMGFLRPSVLPAVWDPLTLVVVPMAPGPYLSLAHSTYKGYDATVRTLNANYGKHLARRQALAQQDEHPATADDATGQANDDIAAEATDPAIPVAAAGAGGDRPYFHTDVRPLLDSWLEAEGAVGDGVTTCDGGRVAGQKCPRDGDQSASPLLTRPSCSAEDFYWSVIARDVAAHDAGHFLTDCDVMLALRDGQREAGESEVSLSYSGEEPLEECLVRPPALTAADSANAKLVSRVRAAVVPPKASEMTAFVRSLRMHNWGIRADFQPQSKGPSKAAKASVVEAPAPPMEGQDGPTSSAVAMPTHSQWSATVSKAERRQYWRRQVAAQDSEVVRRVCAELAATATTTHDDTSATQTGTDGAANTDGWLYWGATAQERGRHRQIKRTVDASVAADRAARAAALQEADGSTSDASGGVVVDSGDDNEGASRGGNGDE